MGLIDDILPDHHIYDSRSNCTYHFASTHTHHWIIWRPYGVMKSVRRKPKRKYWRTCTYVIIWWYAFLTFIFFEIEILCLAVRILGRPQLSALVFSFDLSATFFRILRFLVVHFVTWSRVRFLVKLGEGRYWVSGAGGFLVSASPSSVARHAASWSN